MKHLEIFESETAFDTEKENLPEPCVVLTEDNTKIHIVYTTIDEEDLTKGDFVDLGLPSGLKWASCNLGATKPCEYGDYYMWGSTTPNTNTVCNWANSPFNNGKSKFDRTYFNAHRTEWLDGDVLKPECDAAYVATGKAYIPTETQCQELIDNTTSEWVNCTYLGPDHANHNIMGRKFTSKTNGNSIFFPASGDRNGSSFNSQGSYGSVWSSTLYSDNPIDAWFLYLGLTGCGMDDSPCYAGLALRPVSE